MKFVFIFIVLVHGLIHLVGFTRSHRVGENHLPTEQQKADRFRGVFTIGWLLSCILFISTIPGLFLGTSWWLQVLVVAVIISQVMILLHWKEAKAGTILNVMIALVIIGATGFRGFSGLAVKEVQKMLAGSVKNTAIDIAGENRLDSLPLPVQHYLRYAGVIGKPVVNTVKVKQSGDFTMKAGQRPVYFEAEQFYAVQQASFVWLAQMYIAGVPVVEVHDQYINGKGAMYARAAGFFTVADARGPEIDEGSQVRLLSEMVWFPSAFLNANIIFKPVNDSTFIVILHDHGRDVQVTMLVDPQGRLQQLHTKRYYAHDGSFSLEEWQVDMQEYGVRNGCNIPVKCTVAWKLKQGDLVYATINVGEVSVNPVAP